MSDYRRGYFAGIARAKHQGTGRPVSGRPRLPSSDPEAYERGYQRGLIAERREPRPHCGECGITLLHPTADMRCGFCCVETQEERSAA